MSETNFSPREIVSELDAEDIARRAMKIAEEICVYTNGNVTVEAIELRA